jgi:hypothetical protein
MVLAESRSSLLNQELTATSFNDIDGQNGAQSGLAKRRTVAKESGTLALANTATIEGRPPLRMANSQYSPKLHGSL